MWKRFTKHFIVFFSLIWICIGLFVFFIDPFSIYSIPVIDGWNQSKAGDSDRITAAVNMIRKKPKVLALGSSRVKHAFDAETLAKHANGNVFYNAGISGASFDEVYAYFLHGLYLEPDLKEVILGIDLFSFQHNRKSGVSFSEERLQRESMTFKDIKNTIFSATAFSKALKTFISSIFHSHEENYILAVGENAYLKEMLESSENYKNYQIGQDKIEKFQLLVKHCKEKGIDLKVFIFPVKAIYWEFYFNNGLWPHVEELKRRLCAIHPIWDFSGFNPITTETLESKGKALYLECSHCTPYTGSLLIQRMFAESSPIDHVGYLLTPDNMEEVFADIHRQRLLWLSNAK